MVFIHGGAFLIGNGNDINKRPDYLMAKDVILVSINYRLGALGKILYFQQAMSLFEIKNVLSRVCISRYFAKRYTQVSFVISCTLEIVHFSRFLKYWS